MGMEFGWTVYATMLAPLLSVLSLLAAHSLQAKGRPEHRLNEFGAGVADGASRRPTARWDS